jgi:hypothetical protein
MMYQIALQQFTQAKVSPLQGKRGVLTHVELNHHEFQCIEIALTGLEEMIRNNQVPVDLTDVTLSHLSAQLSYLKHWLDQPELKERLRFDGKNSVLWPCTSSELVDWLLRVCQSCINEDAILIMATNSASCEYADFAAMYLEDDDSDVCSFADDMVYSNFSAFQCYYNDIVTTCRLTLIDKLTAIQAQGYPLFPRFTLLN